MPTKIKFFICVVGLPSATLLEIYQMITARYTRTVIIVLSKHTYLVTRIAMLQKSCKLMLKKTDYCYAAFWEEI